MPVSLVATKYHRPAPAPDLVARPQLIRLLDRGFQCRLILLSAPAGFGKTSLLVEWLAGAQSATRNMHNEPTPAAAGEVGPQQHSGWLSLDQDDTTPTRFWAYVIAALQTIAPEVGRAAQAALQSTRPVPLETVLATLINDLYGLAHPLVLVLDDYHLITASAIHQSLDYLLEHLPQQLRLVIATREDPPLALSRLRARGQLAELRAADLRFSPVETAALLNETLALDLTAEEVALLAERTEGWATGLRLAALSLRQAADRHTFIRDFSASHRFVTDYLMDEVLSRLSPSLQRFLRRTAVLRRLCAPLCDYLLEAEDSQQQLDQLEQGNLFLVPLDHTRHWYRYHHLFAEFLRLHLRATEPDLVPALYWRAAVWCRDQGLLREALGYALEIPDHTLYAGGEAAPSAPDLPPSAFRLSPLDEPLNERELEVLRLMAVGLPNRAIGDKLALSVNTVRWYASQIFAKLDVHGRGAAVARARELGLV